MVVEDFIATQPEGQLQEMEGPLEIEEVIVERAEEDSVGSQIKLMGLIEIMGIWLGLGMSGMRDNGSGDT